MKTSSEKVVKIRQVREGDLPAVVNIKLNGWQTAYRGIIDDTYLDGLGNTYEFELEKIKQNYKKGGFVVAEMDGEIVGFCRYAFDNSLSLEIKDADCELMALYVEPDLRFTGIGTKMFNYVLGEFGRMGKTKMVLWCLNDNESSKRFYAKMGGEIVKEKATEIDGKKYKLCCFEYDLGANSVETR